MNKDKCFLTVAPHSSTGKKPSFLLFGFDCRSPTETAFLPVRTKSLRATDVRR